jgi:hypothetical protein
MRSHSEVDAPRDLFAVAPRQMKPAPEKPPSKRTLAVFNIKIVRSEPVHEFDDSLADIFPGVKLKLARRRAQRVLRRRSMDFLAEIGRYRQGGSSA